MAGNGAFTIRHNGSIIWSKSGTNVGMGKGLILQEGQITLRTAGNGVVWENGPGLQNDSRVPAAAAAAAAKKVAAEKAATAAAATAKKVAAEKAAAAATAKKVAAEKAAAAAAAAAKKAKEEAAAAAASKKAALEEIAKNAALEEAAKKEAAKNAALEEAAKKEAAVEAAAAAAAAAEAAKNAALEEAAKKEAAVEAAAAEAAKKAAKTPITQAGSAAPAQNENKITPENILQKLNTIMRKGDGFSESLMYNLSINTYKEGIDIYKQLMENNDKLDDTLIQKLHDMVIQFNQKIATEYRDKASSLKCDKTNDPTSENCKNADEALRLAKEYRSKTIADMCSEVTNSDSDLCKNTENTSPSDNVNEKHTDTIHPHSLIKGLTVNNVTPSPLYNKPGTVKYGGLGYNPSYTDINYMNNKFTTKPEIVNRFNKKGFCDLSNNIMENINEKCENLPKGVCATTSCCVLIGDQKCVQGDAQGPKNDLIYSDTTIKNKDVYYYQGKCYGNCT
jgi:hypothetical protein